MMKRESSDRRSTRIYNTTAITHKPNNPSTVSKNRWYSKRSRKRLVYKNGDCNISHVNCKRRLQRYHADILTTLIDIRWRWNLLIFVLTFTLSWLIFALIWWLICFTHGDFQNRNDPDWKPCVVGVYDFTTALLFSIETQHTIGYGSKQTSDNCPTAIMPSLSSLFGVILQVLMTRIVFAKLSRPKMRAETLMFTKNAVICKRDNVYCLLFRVGDMQKSHLVEAHVRVILIRKRQTMEGEDMPLHQQEMKMSDIENEYKLFLVWPVILEHKIDKESPLWNVSAENLQRQQFEIIVIIEGVVESTGMTVQARTSYLSRQILWGNRFEHLVTFQLEDGRYQIDYSRFNSTIPTDTPQCSAHEYDLLVNSSSSSINTRFNMDVDENRSYDDDDDMSLITSSM